MKNTQLEDDGLNKTLAVILTIVAIVTFFMAALTDTTPVAHGDNSYHAHHIKTCGFRSFIQGKCFPRI